MFYNNPDDDDDARSRVYDERNWKIAEKDNLQARDGQGPQNVRYQIVPRKPTENQFRS